MPHETVIPAPPTFTIPNPTTATTVNDCCTWVAAFQFAFPAWFASITHVPAAMNVTTPAEIEHTDVADASIVSAAASPDVAVAVAVYVAPPTVVTEGTVEVNVTVWFPLEMVKLLWTCAAAFQFAFPA